MSSKEITKKQLEDILETESIDFGDETINRFYEYIKQAISMMAEGRRLRDHYTAGMREYRKSKLLNIVGGK